MSHTPLLSVVIPSYNNARFIDETVESVLDQDVSDFELVIADHSSTDGTWEKLQAYRSHPSVRLMRTDSGGGAERNFDRVSREARGRYIKLLPGDDLLKRGVLKRQVELLERHPGATLTACPREFVDSTGRTILPRRGLAGTKSLLSGADAIRKTVRRGSNIFGEPACVMMRTSDLAEQGFWFFDYPYLVDQATYMRVLLRGDFIPDTEVGAAFRMNSNQWSVALTRHQAEQARALHGWMRSHHPEILSAGDVRIGDGRAFLLARARKLSYSILRRRMG